MEASAEQTRPDPATIDELQDLLADQLYITDRGLAISIFLALRLGRPSSWRESRASARRRWPRCSPPVWAAT